MKSIVTRTKILVSLRRWSHHCMWYFFMMGGWGGALRIVMNGATTDLLRTALGQTLTSLSALHYVPLN